MLFFGVAERNHFALPQTDCREGNIVVPQSQKQFPVPDAYAQAR